MTTPFALDPSLDTAAAGALRQELIGRLDRKRPLLLDGDRVKRVGLACLQVLAAGRAAAAVDGVGYAIARPSPAMREMATLAGLDAVLEPLD